MDRLEALESTPDGPHRLEPSRQNDFSRTDSALSPHSYGHHKRLAAGIPLGLDGGSRDRRQELCIYWQGFPQLGKHQASGSKERYLRGQHRSLGSGSPVRALRSDRGIMPVIRDHAPSGLGISACYACDRGAARLDPGACDHMHNKQMRTFIWRAALHKNTGRVDRARA